jgi:nucleoside-diphosphate-sugar epimerase
VAITGRNLDLDTSRARTELGWRSKVSYEAAMQRIKEWVLAEFLPSVR